MKFRLSGLNPQFWLYNVAFLSSKAERVSEWKGKIVDCVQDFLGKLFSRNVEQRNVGEWAEQIELFMRKMAANSLS